MSRILITGGAGFIGSQLGHALDRAGHEVWLIDNMSDGHEDNLTIAGERFGRFVKADVRSPEMAGLLAGVDTVFHFAATSSLPKCQSDPAAAYDNNVTGVLNMLELSRRAGVRRFVFSSTSAVYENTKQTPFSEAAPLAPDLVYAMTKQAAEQACRGFAQTCGMDVVIVRFFNIFGEHQDIHRPMPPFVSYLAREVFLGRRPVLFNASAIRRDYVYVSDVIDCLTRILQAAAVHRGEVFNICTGTGASVPEIVEMFAQISGREIRPDYADPQAFWDKFPALFTGAHPLSRARIEAEVFKESIGDPRKTEQAFGFRATVSMQAGLQRFHDHCLRQLRP